MFWHMKPINTHFESLEMWTVAIAKDSFRLVFSWVHKHFHTIKNGVGKISDIFPPFRWKPQESEAEL